MERSNEETIKNLELFGLNRLQARVYFSLYTLGETPASTVAEVCQIHRVEAYRILRELLNMRAVDRLISHPVRYRAKNPYVVLKNLSLPFVEKMAELSEARTRILTNISSKPLLMADYGSEKSFELLQGNMVHKRAVAMIDAASNEILYSFRFYPDIFAALSDPFSRTIMRGVTAKGLLYVDKRTIEIVKRLVRNRKIVRKHSDYVYSFLLIVDGKKMVFSSAPNPHSDEAFLFTKDRRFIQHYIRSFKLLFKDGIPISKRIEELNDDKVALRYNPSRPSRSIHSEYSLLKQRDAGT